jgi:branched-chain amino acid transport system permease protein
MLLTDILISGLIIGGIYAFMALGLTLQYGVARILNLAYGEFFIAAAFGAYWLFTSLKVSPLTGLTIIIPLAFAVNWALYRYLLTPLVRRARNRAELESDSILFTFGLLFVVQGLVLAGFGGNYYSYSYLSVPVNILGSIAGQNRLLAFGAAIILGAGLYLLLTRTRIGTSIRALAVNPLAARLVAIDVPRMSAFTFALGGALCAAGGVLISTFFTFNAAMGVQFTMKALIVVIMGGAGNILGAVAAGLLLGVAETSVARLIDPGLTLAVNFALFILVLLIRPTGLFGRAT